MLETYKKLLYYHYFNKKEDEYKKQVEIFKNKFNINRNLKAGYPVITKEELKQLVIISKSFILMFVNNFLKTIKDYFIINCKKNNKELLELINCILYNKSLITNNDKIELIKNKYLKNKRDVMFKLNNLFNIICEYYDLNNIIDNKTLELNIMKKFSDVDINKINIIDIRYKLNYDNNIILIFGNNIINYLIM